MDTRAVYRADKPKLRQPSLDADLLNGSATSWSEERKRLTFVSPVYVENCDGTRDYIAGSRGPVVLNAVSKAQLRADANDAVEQFRAKRAAQFADAKAARDARFQTLRMIKRRTLNID